MHSKKRNAIVCAALYLLDMYFTMYLFTNLAPKSKQKVIWRVFLLLKKGTFTLNICIFTTTEWIVVFKHHCVLIARLSFYGMYYFLEVYSSGRGIWSTALFIVLPLARAFTSQACLDDYSRLQALLTGPSVCMEVR